MGVRGSWPVWSSCCWGSSVPHQGAPQWIALLVLWALLGAATSTILTPSARLLRRNSTEQSRPSVFAAQFALSHACFLITYPVAGALGATIGLQAVALVLVGIGVVGAAAALLTWRAPAGRTIPARPAKNRTSAP
ncbi:MAG TPA: MFS transporter [Beutenbergiaceae bacterium]|nr:MFS transporter [Beutenbergiaceae bacterium]